MTTSATVPEKLPTDRSVSSPGVLRRFTQNYYVRRIARALLMIWVVSTIIFFLIRLLPGNPVDQYIARLIETQGMDYENARTQAAARFAIDLDAPLWQQYAEYIWNLLHFNLGVSITSPGSTGPMPAGVPGAIVATVGIFLPGFVFVAVTNPFIPRLRQSPWLAALLDGVVASCLLYTSPSPRDRTRSRMPSSA